MHFALNLLVYSFSTAVMVVTCSGAVAPQALLIGAVVLLFCLTSAVLAITIWRAVRVSRALARLRKSGHLP